MLVGSFIVWGKKKKFSLEACQGMYIFDAPVITVKAMATL